MFTMSFNLSNEQIDRYRNNQKQNQQAYKKQVINKGLDCEPETLSVTDAEQLMIINHYQKTAKKHPYLITLAQREYQHKQHKETELAQHVRSSGSRCSPPHGLFAQHNTHGRP